jgi:hypothetical protein
MPENTYLFKNKGAKDFKSLKERMKVLCCANMTGEEGDLLVIGKTVKFFDILKVSEICL